MNVDKDNISFQNRVKQCRDQNKLSNYNYLHSNNYERDYIIDFGYKKDDPSKIYTLAPLYHRFKDDDVNLGRNKDKKAKEIKLNITSIKKAQASQLSGRQKGKLSAVKSSSGRISVRKSRLQKSENGDGQSEVSVSASRSMRAEARKSSKDKQAEKTPTRGRGRPKKKTTVEANLEKSVDEDVSLSDVAVA